MNCECFYVVKNNTLEAARELSKRINKCAKRQGEEVYPVYISKVKKDFNASECYDGLLYPFRIEKGTILVFAQGKDYSMYRIRRKGMIMGFPHHDCHEDFFNNFSDYIEDIEECNIE